LIYCEAVETGLRSENARLATELHETQLDLEDSKRSRRDLQQQLNRVTQLMGQSTADCDQMRVGRSFLGGKPVADGIQNRNPYIMVLIDGDGMIVGIHSRLLETC
jgi:hypothetical protein